MSLDKCIDCGEILFRFRCGTGWYHNCSPKGFHKNKAGTALVSNEP